MGWLEFVILRETMPVVPEEVLRLTISLASLH